MRLEGKVSIVTGAGQTPGQTIGNGRATSLLLAREGSKVLLVDRDVERARETREMIEKEGGEAAEVAADVTAGNAKYGVRCNAVLPGLMNTPMAIDAWAERAGIPREEAVRRRDAVVPMGKMGTAWDVAYAVLYLASDESGFVTGALLPVDGGQAVGP